MSYERFIGTRYLMAKRRRSVLSIITVISVFGVALGVTALIVVLSVMGGFKKDLKEKIIGQRAHVVFKPLDGDFLEDHAAVEAVARGEAAVIGASPYLESEVMVSSPTNLSGVILRGVDVHKVGAVSNLVHDIEKGKIEFLEDARPMLQEIEKQREEDLGDLLKRVRKERDEVEAELDRVPNPEFEAEVPEALKELEALPPVEDLEDGADRYGDEGYMPGLLDEALETEEEGGMPPIDDGVSASDDLPGLIVGRELARSLQVSLGDEVNVVTPNGEMGPMGPIPRSRPFRVVGVFYSGMYEYDANYAYTSISSAQAFLSVEGITGIELKTVNVDEAPLVAERLQAAVPAGVDVLDWQELNRSLFYALKLEKIAMFVVLTFIILVASFSIVAMLIMIVIEKGREIAILKAIGATNGGVMRTFVFQGLVIGIVGAILGLLFGLGICWFLAEFGFPLNSEVYYISTLPVDVDPTEITLVVFAAILISLMATIYPSIQAARLNPVQGLRDD
jgi:lipoprotein-releasing system permease protein